MELKRDATVGSPNRRELLHDIGAVAMTCLLGDRTFGMGEQPRVTATSAVDHLLLGVAEREAGIEWVEHKTGVKALVGGSHPGVGTCNALLSLGGRQYLEIIAPDPTQTRLAPQYEVLKTLSVPRLITWAAATQDARATAERFRAARFEVSGPTRGSRNRPDGKLMSWQTLSVTNDLGGLIPFFIEWDATVTHPSADSPQGCRLRSIEFTHQRAEVVRDTLGRLGIEASVTQSADARMKAILTTLKGTAELS
jgi:Glyoxalase-like domain